MRGSTLSLSSYWEAAQWVLALQGACRAAFLLVNLLFEVSLTDFVLNQPHTKRAWKLVRNEYK